jgi:hypothetical protein
MYLSLTNRKTFLKLPICKRALVCLIVSIGLFNCDLYAQNFTEIPTQILGLNISSGAWGDYDNDGDLDLLLTGIQSYVGGVTKLYQNNAGSFTEITTSLPGVRAGSVNWGDYDNDNDLDILISGASATGNFTRLLRNDNQTFTATPEEFAQVSHSSSAFGDYDNDGDLDILISGLTDDGSVTKNIPERIGKIC